MGWVKRRAWDTTQAPGVVVERSTLDLGAFPFGTIGRTDIRILNSGPQTYAVESATTDCGCTSVSCDTRKLAVGGQLLLKVTIDSSIVHGPQFQKFIELRLRSDLKQYVVSLPVQGIVKRSPSIVALPSKIDLGTVLAGEDAERDIEFVGPDNVTELLPARISIDALKPDLLITSKEPSQYIGIKKTKLRVLIPNNGGHNLHFDFNMRIEGGMSQKLCIPVDATVASKTG
jgi:hypothetical protein